MAPDLRLESFSEHSSVHITARQAQILRLIARGLPDKEIARALGISPRTIGSHLRRVFEKNGIHKRSAMVAAWLALGREPERTMRSMV
jgi:DNA-binding CsgD family transcriptional regulator